jgi:DNA topoisomerase-1
VVQSIGHMQLVVVESPTKAKKIGQYLGDEYTVRASMGHIRDLPKSKLGVDIEANFEPSYVIPTKSRKTLTELKKLAKSADTIILATDPDREGEAIAWHLLEAFKEKNIATKSKRAVFHEITKEAVLDAMSHPGEINDALVDAQQARRVLDRLVGYQISPLLWKKIRAGLSAGRVQSVALRLIVEREREIAAFKPEEYWEIDLHFLTPGKDELVARVIELAGEKFEPKKAEEVDALKAWVDKAQYVVRSVEKKERKRQAFAPFTTSTLQQAAATRLGYSSKQTMTLAQQLYEEGYITYHRTDSVNLSQQAVAMAREYIGKEFGKEYLPAKANTYKAKSKNAQEAHEAIRTTSVVPQMPKEGGLTEKHARLYDLIFRRFVASQMVPAVYDITTIEVEGKHGSEQLAARASGSIIKMMGWMKLFPGGDDTILPAVEAKQVMEYQSMDAAQKFTQPPPRYNDASLVKELEKRGIGRPSTYASIIEVLVIRRYVQRENKAFIPTDIGMTVIDFLILHFPSIVDYDFTASLEDQLDEISRGEKEWVKVMKDFYSPFAKKLEEVAENASRMKIPVEALDQPCPKCGVSEAEFAQLVAAGATISGRDDDYEPELDADGKPIKGEHGELVLRSGRFGKFISCSRYPECDHTANYKKTIGMHCPDCATGEVVEKTTRRGKVFYGCSEYPTCKWASWKNPLEEKEKQEPGEGASV